MKEESKSFLAKMLKKPTKKERITCTISGEAGVGKTTLAALFPKPVFLCAENGIESVSHMEDVRVIHLNPYSTKANILLQFNQVIGALIKEEHDRETLVIDSISKLDDLFQEMVADRINRRNNLEKRLRFSELDKNHGNTYLALRELHLTIKELCDKLHAKKNMNIVFICHTKERVDSPPEAEGESFVRYDLNLFPTTRSIYLEGVDLAAFVKFKHFYKKKDKSKAGDRRATGVCQSSERREIIISGGGIYPAKNRLGIDRNLQFNNDGTNPIIKALNEKPTKVENESKPKQEEAEPLGQDLPPALSEPLPHDQPPQGMISDYPDHDQQEGFNLDVPF